MSNNNIKFDLGQTVRQVEQLEQAVNGLVSKLSSSMGQLAQMGNAVGQVVTQANNISPSNATSQRGSDIIEQQAMNAARNLEDLQSGRITLRSVDDRDDYYRTTSMGNQRVPGNPDAWRGQIEAYENNFKNDLKNVLGGNNAPDFSGTPGVGGYTMADTAPSRPALHGLGVKDQDVPRIYDQAQKMSQGLQGIDDTLRKLRDSDDRRERLIADKLENFVSEFKKYSEKFDRNQNMLETGDISPARRQRLERMQKDYAGGLRESQEGIDDLMTQYGGGGGGRGGSLMGERLSKGLGIAAGGLAGAMAVGQTYLSAQQALDRTMYGATMDTAIARGRAQALTGQTVMEMRDMTDASNLLRYGADQVMGREFGFIGTRGLANSYNEAISEIGMGREMQRRQRLMGVLGGATQVGTSVLTTAGGVAAASAGGPIGLGLGTGMMSQGVSGISGGMNSMAQSYFGSPYSAYMGLQDSRVAMMIGGDGADRMARAAQAREIATNQLNMQTRTREVQDAELSGLAPQRMALQRLLDIENAEKQAVGMVGGSALSRNEITQGYYGKATIESTNARKALEESAKSRNQIASNLVNNALRGDAKLALQAYGPSSIIGDIAANERAPEPIFAGDPRTAQEIGIGRAYANSARAISISAQMKALAEADEDVREKEMVSRNVSGLGRTPFERLEMTQSEFVLRNAQLMNVMNLSGRGADYQDLTENVVRTSRAGLGDLDAVMGNLSAISQVSGVQGAENYSKLRQVMSDAVQLGFDKSRTAQAFIQTSTSIAENLNIRNVEAASGFLGTAASIASNNIGGRANEFALREAARGIQSVAGFTGQRAGFVGGMGAMGMMEAGGSISDVIGMGGTDLVQARSFMEDIDSANGNVDRIQNPEVREAILIEKQNLMRGGATATEAERQAFSKTRSMFGSRISSSATVFSQAFSAANEGSSMNAAIDDLIKEASTGQGDQFKEKLTAFRGRMRRGATLMGLDPSAASAMVTSMMESRGLNLNRTSANTLTNMEDTGNALYRDPANQAMLRFIDEVVTTMPGVSEGTDLGVYYQYLNADGSAMSVADGNYLKKEHFRQAFGKEDNKKRQRARSLITSAVGEDVNFDQFEDLESFLRAQDAATDKLRVKDLTKVDLLRGASELPGVDAIPQNVKITNISDISKAMEESVEIKVRAMLDEQGNKDTTTGVSEIRR